MVSIDRSIFFIFYNFSYHSRVVDFLIKFFGDYFLYVVLFAFVFVLYKKSKGSLRQLKLYIFVLFSAFVARFVVAQIIRLFIHRPRPFLTFSLPHLINDTAYSFPSGHTIFIFALATATYFFNKKLSYFLYISGLLIGFARIAGGVHYPYDIAGGIILGIATGIVLHVFCKLLGPQKIDQ